MARYYLLITGSRKANDKMLRIAYAAVYRAREHGWYILVGDAAGVDTAVMQACDKLRVPYVCCGITEFPRHGQPINYMQIKGGYLDRDLWMARNCDRCFAIWNGESRGTKYTYDQARKLGKPADIRIYLEEPARPPMLEGWDESL